MPVLSPVAFSYAWTSSRLGRPRSFTVKPLDRPQALIRPNKPATFVLRAAATELDRREPPETFRLFLTYGSSARKSSAASSFVKSISYELSWIAKRTVEASPSPDRSESTVTRVRVAMR